MLRWITSVLLIAAAGVTEFHFVSRAGGLEQLTGNDFLLATFALELALVTWLLWSLVEDSVSGVRIASVCLLGNLGAQFYLFDLVGPDPSAGELQRFYLAGIGVIVFALINIMLGARDKSDSTESDVGRAEPAGAGQSGNPGATETGATPDPEKMERAAQMAQYELEAEGEAGAGESSRETGSDEGTGGGRGKESVTQAVPERPATPDPEESAGEGEGLVVVSGPETGEFYELDAEEDSWVLGRGARADITISDPAVSRDHCKIRRSDTGFTVEDLGSTNGTFVNDTKIEGNEVLASGDRLQLGGVTLRLESGTPQSPPDDSDPVED